MDLAMTRELFENYLSMLKTLEMEDTLSEKIEDALGKLYPFKIGQHGQLQEWDQDYDECTPGMGHVSHLYTVYPSSVISESKSLELFEAARKSFLRRRMHSGLKRGWPGAWGLALAARFKEGMLCGTMNRSVAEGLGANMLSKGYYQIDCVMGWGAAIAEMLLQSHDGIVDILPALPPLWVKGFIKGIRARRGLMLDIAWENGTLKSVDISAQSNGTYKVCYKNKTIDIEIVEGKTVHLDGELSVLGSSVNNTIA
jgi:alpha-L-fucosidase 2